MMNGLYESHGDIGSIAEEPVLRLSDNNDDRVDSCYSRMVVSDDDVSVTWAKNAQFSSTDLMKVGSASSHTETTFMSSGIFDDSHLVTPFPEDSKEVVTTTTTEHNGKKTNLPFCPATADDSKTANTIQLRDKRAVISLVDEYEASQCRTYDESCRHHFNACRSSKPVDSPGGKRILHQPPIIENLSENLPSHNLLNESHNNGYHHNESAPTLNTSSQSQQPNLITQHNQPQPQPQPQPHQQQQSYLASQPFIERPHKIVSDEYNTTTTMPSKIVAHLPRQRSRAIAIKRSRPVEFLDTATAFVDKEVRKCDVELYDYATWRMYNRIIDHRRKALLLQTQHEDDYSEEHQPHRDDVAKTNATTNHSGTSHRFDDNNASAIRYSSNISQRRFVHRNVPYSDDEHSTTYEEDEIFDFEL